MEATQRTIRLWLVGTTAVLVFAPLASAVDKEWYVQEGAWNDPSNWRPVGVPVSDDTAIVDQGEVQFNTTTPAQCARLTFGSAGGSIGRMLMDYSGANLHVGGTMFVGDAGVGSYVQTAGSAYFVQVHLGESSGGDGYVSLGGSESYFRSTNWVYVGDRGRGTFVQTGGSSDLISCIGVGLGTGSFGLCVISGGTMNTDGE